MGEANSPSVAHVGYDISPLSRVKLKILTTRLTKYRNPRATEGESIYNICPVPFIAWHYVSYRVQDCKFMLT